MLGTSFKMAETLFGNFRFNKQLLASSFATVRFVRQRKIFLCFLIIANPWGDFSCFTSSHSSGSSLSESVTIASGCTACGLLCIRYASLDCSTFFCSSSVKSIEAMLRPKSSKTCSTKLDLRCFISNISL